MVYSVEDYSVLFWWQISKTFNLLTFPADKQHLCPVRLLMDWYLLQGLGIYFIHFPQSYDAKINMANNPRLTGWLWYCTMGYNHYLNDWPESQVADDGLTCSLSFHSNFFSQNTPLIEADRITNCEILILLQIFDNGYQYFPYIVILWKMFSNVI